MSEARIDRITNENNTAGPIISGITTFSGQNFFVPPKGTTAQRPSNCPPGSIRFNTDSAKLEYFDNLQWLELEAFNVEIGISTNAAGTSGGLGTRGVFGGGYTPSDVIDYVTISTLGDAIDFGNLSAARYASGSASSRTRGLWMGGAESAVAVNTIEYITISSTGDAINFGDLTQPIIYAVGLSNQTRGIAAGGGTPGAVNNIDYVTIASIGDAQDFGDLISIQYAPGGCSSSTRGVIFGGRTSPITTYTSAISFITNIINWRCSRLWRFECKSWI